MMNKTMDETMEKKNELKKLIDNITRPELIDYLLAFTKSAIKRWG